MEEWRDIKDYEGLYQVSNMGRIKSLNYRRTGREKIMKLNHDKDGYIVVGLFKNKKLKQYKVHRLVAEAFIPNPDNLPQVNHKIDDFEHRSDNRVENLEWCTGKYNSNYGSHNERLSENHADFSNDKHPRAKKVRCITTGEVFTTIKEASEKYNTSKQNICDCLKGRHKSAGKHPVTGKKLVWEYVE